MRYSPNTTEDKNQMLQSIGYSKVEELFDDISEDIRKAAILDVGEGMSEYELRKHLKKIAAKNRNLGELTSFMGAGAYEHYVPSFVDQLLLRSEFYTAYTPYQPEISQGTLQAIFEYQTLICELTAMDAANASVYDGATAAAEAVNMAVAAVKRSKILYSEGLHPEYIQTLKSYAWTQGNEMTGIAMDKGVTSLSEAKSQMNKDVACIVVQYPNFYGCVEDIQKLAEIAHEQKALLIVVNTAPVALGLLTPPGELGADIVAGEGQSFGSSVAFGGPHLGYMATIDKHIRRLPGRIVGKALDVDGNSAFVLTLQAREQHIRREKASSNICSNQALCALAASMTMCAIGKEGLREMAETNLQKAHYAFKKLTSIKGVEAVYPERFFFNEFVLKMPLPAAKITEALAKEGILAGVDLGRFDTNLSAQLLVCVTELRTKEEIDDFAQKLGGVVA